MERGGNLVLNCWLNVATRDLCDEAEERVRVEIRSHYAEMKQALTDSGRTSIDAHREVMAALGSPKTANKRFRRTYLTRYEAGILNGLPTAKRLLAIEVFFGCCSVPRFFMHWQAVETKVLFGILCLHWILAAVAYPSLRAFSQRRGTLLSFVLSQCLLLSICAVFGWLVVITSYGLPSLAQPALLALASAVFVALCSPVLVYFPVYRKLGKEKTYDV